MPPPLADRLAVTRTVLANERTLLAYVRTGLAVMAGGVGLAEVAQARVLALVGWVLVPLGALLLLTGAARFRRVRGQLSVLHEPPPDRA